MKRNVFCITFLAVLHHLRFAFLLGTLFLPLLLFLLKLDINANFWIETLLWWSGLIIISLLLKFFTTFKDVAGSTISRWQMKRRPSAMPESEVEIVSEPADVPYLPTGFIREVGELILVGEFIAMGIGLLPGFLMVLLAEELAPGLLTGRLAVAVFGAISSAWILFLEKRYMIRLTSPLFGIPLKWVLIPMFIFLIIYGDPA